MKPIAEPVPVEILKKELKNSIFLTKTSKGSNELYVIDNHSAPSVLREIGRLREIAFRTAGGGTGEEIDLDECDLKEDYPHQQLIVWDPEENRICGGYRLFFCSHIKDSKKIEEYSATAKLFHFSETFQKEYFPYAIELGRSFIIPELQSSSGRKKGIFLLDNLWEGLGMIVAEHSEIKYLFGKVTIFPDYDLTAKRLVLFFLRKHFSSDEALLTPKYPLEIDIDEKLHELLFLSNDMVEDYKMLLKYTSKLKTQVPPLINSYLNVSPVVRFFGASVNKGFGSVAESGILLSVKDIYDAKKKRYLILPKKRIRKLLIPKLRKKK